MSDKVSFSIVCSIPIDMVYNFLWIRFDHDSMESGNSCKASLKSAT